LGTVYVACQTPRDRIQQGRFSGSVLTRERKQFSADQEIEFFWLVLSRVEVMKTAEAMSSDAS
jgi:hypothetical protein